MVLGRARRSVLVVDAGEPRNAPAAHTHGFLTRDGTPPGELLELGRAEVRGLRRRGPKRTRRCRPRRCPAAGSRCSSATGDTVRARRLLVTTGLVDELPDVPGVRGALGPRRHPLPVLPRLGGPGPGDRRPRVAALLVGAPGAAVPAVDRQT
ncbi:MAG: hypothetical protein WKF47_11775 [Geodermatophilaceae bacterium]